jgi:hypothetical protein
VRKPVLRPVQIVRFLRLIGSNAVVATTCRFRVDGAFENLGPFWADRNWRASLKVTVPSSLRTMPPSRSR